MKKHPLFQLVIARLREFWREPAAIFWVYGFPLIMAVALGLAFRSKPVVQTVRVDVVQTGDAWTESVADSLSTDDRFEIHRIDEEQWPQRLRTGDTDLVIRPGETSDPPSYEIVLDPTKPGSVVGRNAADDALQRAAGRLDPVSVTVAEFDEPGGRYIDFLIPGLLGMSLMGGGLWGVGFAIVDLRIRKLLKRYLATPMKRWHFMLGIMISRMIFMIPEMVLLVLFAWLFFGVQIHGSLLVVVLLILIGAMQFSGIGLLIASRCKTLESVSGLMNLTMLPMWIASGIFFKPENFPDVMQPIINLLPLTPLIRALRGVMLEATPLTELGPELLMICIWGVVTFVVALVIFRWE